MARLEIYWSFRSPYSYLAIDRLADIDRDYDVETHFRPVRPLAMREPDFFERGRKQFLPYLFRDVPREAERLGLPFGLPQPDPITMDMASGKVDPEQPILLGVIALAFAAIEKGRGIEFARAVAPTIWGGKQNWNDESVLSVTLSDAGFDYADLTSWALENQAVIDDKLAMNEAAQLEYHWGVPLMVLDGEPFFGQDRMDSLIWRLDKLGLRREAR